jgi:hypothetical protein
LSKLCFSQISQRLRFASFHENDLVTLLHLFDEGREFSFGVRDIANLHAPIIGNQAGSGPLDAILRLAIHEWAEKRDQGISKTASPGNVVMTTQELLIRHVVTFGP